jgi:uncharacterized protein
VPARYLIVDGHSVIFGWPELCKLHSRRASLARDALIGQLRQYQDWSGVRTVVVFDGKGDQISEESFPNDIQIFYARRGQTADAIVERLASKYASRFEVTVATSDYLERQTVITFGAVCISPDDLRELVQTARPRRKI